MPLIQSKSKKAFKENTEQEMNSGKPRAQSLAIAYSIKNKNKKKMANGGKVNETVKSERIPMPEEKDKDAKMVRMNSGDKPSYQDHVLDQPTLKQARKSSITPLSQPKLVGSDAFSVRSRKEMDEEEHLMRMAEGGAVKPEKPSGGTLNYKDLRKEYIAKNKPRFAEGGEVEYGPGPEEDEEPPVPSKHADDRQLPVDEYMANHFAEGGSIEREEDEQPEPEEEDEHYDSIAAAIMAKKNRQSEDDHMMKMAEGGEVDIDENNEEQPNGYYNRNEEAALKENHDSDMDGISDPMDSDEHGDHLSDEDAHSMIDRIRSRMSLKRAFR